MLRGIAQYVVMWLGCFGSAPLVWYHCGSLYGISDFYASLYPLKPARIFIDDLVTCRSSKYDHFESICEGSLCAGVCVDVGCCYRIGVIRRQTVW